MELHFGWEEGKYGVLSPGFSSVDTCLDMASALCVVCKETVLGETWQQGHLAHAVQAARGLCFSLGFQYSPMQTTSPGLDQCQRWPSCLLPLLET